MCHLPDGTPRIGLKAFAPENPDIFPYLCQLRKGQSQVTAGRFPGA
jgi:hypothetical protein